MLPAGRFYASPDGFDADNFLYPLDPYEENLVRIKLTPTTGPIYRVEDTPVDLRTPNPKTGSGVAYALDTLSRQIGRDVTAHTLSLHLEHVDASLPPVPPRLYAFVLYVERRRRSVVATYENLLQATFPLREFPFLAVTHEPTPLRSVRERNDFASAILAVADISYYRPRVLIVNERVGKRWQATDPVGKGTATLDQTDVDWLGSFADPKQDTLIEALADTYHQLKPDDQPKFLPALERFDLPTARLHLALLTRR